MLISDIVKTRKDEGKEEHFPVITIDKGHKAQHDIVRVVVGHESPHPNIVEHHIVWIELFGVKINDNRVVDLGRAACAPVFSNPNVRFQVNGIDEFRGFYALAYCNVHGLWGNFVERYSGALPTKTETATATPR
ncbi:MAG: desulfoferrodoxin family protein [Desulfomonilaceae bacterium]